MTKSYRDRVSYLEEADSLAEHLVERLRARSRLVRLMGQQNDLSMGTQMLLREAADRIEKLERERS